MISKGVQTDSVYHDPSRPELPKKHNIKKKKHRETYYYNLLNK